MDERFRIDRIIVRELVIPLKVPFRLSGGTCRARRSLIVEVQSGGATGHGESAPFDEPFYSPETIGTVLSLYRELYLPRLAGRSFESLDDLDRELRRGVRGCPFARAGIENACWDLCCRRAGIPLVDAVALRMLTRGVPAEAARPRPTIESGVAVGIPEDESLETLARWIEDHASEGYRRVKVKIRPGWDAVACAAARQVLGRSFPLWADANASFDLGRDLERLRALDRFGLLFLEQPLEHDDLLDHARLAREISTPICLDESLSSARAARQALEAGASRIWNIKVQRLGGLIEAIEVYRIGVEAGAALWAGTMPESGIGAQAAIALGAFPGFVHAADVEPSSRWYEPRRDPVEIAMSADGLIEVPRAAGIEALIDRDRYEKLTRVVAEAAA
jgi:O-succinylbenzoate synthase